MTESHDNPLASLSVDELFNGALMETDEDRYWELVPELHKRGSNEVLQWARQLGRGECSNERQLAANVLAQLGVPERTFPDACVHLLKEMLCVENDPQALNAILVALNHHELASIVEIASPYATHPDADVRWAVVWCLCGEDAGIPLLVELSRDSDADVRDWATFGLGTQSSVDTSEVREALIARLDDTDDDTRGEAMMGLAIRNDPRVVPAIERQLRTDPNDYAREAAEILNDPEFRARMMQNRELSAT